MKPALAALSLALLAALPACGAGGGAATPRDPFDLMFCRPYDIEPATLGIGDMTLEPGEFAVTVAPDGVGGERLLLRLDETRAAELAEMTQGQVGKFIPVTVDAEVLMRPTVMEPILGGELEITGVFTRRELENYAQRLSLPCEAYEQ